MSTIIIDSDYEYSDESDIELQKDTILDAKDVVFTNKETYYYKMVDKFFKNTTYNNIKKMLDIINKESHVSLRLLDWFVTKYANNKKISYELNNDNERFNVHISYKAHLRSYKKRYFDPFRRRKKFKYSYLTDDNKIEKMYTTIGQLNFFRWAFMNNVIDYVEQNYKIISASMGLSNKIDKKRKQSKKQKVQKVQINKGKVNISAEKKVSKDLMKIIVSFD